ncbi:hypothetical protein [Asticcacaulis tiandongensis]|uniref:hypothetical protein n=1 Tax=Asticcacaulis tiandongensis TaxID=2565365 RepID=UPI001C63C841|nr:hypothetical protein [Asticcacaulis tiandongensis]
MRNKVTQQILQNFKLIGLRLYAYQEIANGNRGNQHAIAVKIPVQTIGIDKVGERLEVALLLCLIGIFQRAQADRQVFGFNMADADLAALQDKVRRPNRFAFGFVDGANGTVKAVYKLLKGRSVGMFSGSARLEITSCKKTVTAHSSPAR